MRSREHAWSISDQTRRGITLSWLVLFVLSILLQYGNLTNPSAALAVHDDGIFELDGNALDQAGIGHEGDDWENGEPGAAATLFIPGSVENDGVDTTYFAQGGSKDHHDISDWHYSATDVAPDKDELLDVFAAAYDTADGTNVYFGADKFDDSGDAQIGFWFFQNAVSLGANGLFNGVHTVGDVLVLSDFTNGGVVDLICVYEWNPPGDNIATGVPTDTGCDIGNNVTLAAAGAECDVSGPDGSFDVCAVVNTGPADTSPWPFVNKDGATSFGAGQFFEGGLNLDELFDGDAPCFSGFLAETRSSQEVEAQLKDFALGTLNTCQPPDIQTEVSSSTITIGGSVTDTADLTGNDPLPTGTITFWVCGPATPDCTTGGTQVGSPVTIVAGSATSTAFTPSAAGTYCFRADYAPDAAGSLHYTAGSHTNLGSECFTVNMANPSITTAANQTVLAGTAIHDSATLSGGFSPTGSITFRAYGPNDATCAAAAVFTSAPVAVNGNGTYGPVEFTPLTSGVYRWIASYSGDVNNNAATGACNDAGETDTVNKVTPTIATSANETVTIGASISDSATLSGGVSPTGTITFRAYGPNDATCAGAAVFTSAPVAVSGNGTYGPVSFEPAAVGTYRWIASYSGDGNNNAVSGACNDVGENDTVNKTNPSIATVLHGGGQNGASITVPLGTAVHDSSTLSGATAAAGGTVHYQVFSNATCTTLVFDAGTKAVVNGVPGDSNPYTINLAGTYYWQADYSGDAKNNSASSACNLEVATAAANIPSIVTSANQTVNIGGSISDSATLSGGFNPTGSITFRAYGPNDATCAGAAVFTSTPVAVSGNGTYGPVSFTPAVSGIYRWIAVYSGDANNAAVGGACNDAGETDTVNQPQLTILKDVSGNTGGTAANGLPIAKVGDTLTFTLTYDITSPPATHGVITDPIPAGLEYVSGSATTNLEFDEVSYDAATRTLTWRADVVNVDGSVSFKVTVLGTAPALAQPITNVATIDSDETLLDDDDAKVLVQVVLAATATPVVTVPPTDTIDNGDQAPSNPGFGLMLALLVLAGIGLVAGYLTPTPGRIRREEVRRR